MNISKNQEASFFKVTKQYGFFTFFLSMLLLCQYNLAQENKQMIRLAKLQIDTNKLDSYRSALKEEIEISVRIEPGVLSLYAVYEKNNPSYVTIFEIYANEESYNAHRESPHFKKYKAATKDMVMSLELIEVIPVILGSKGGDR